jgi:hypothetical protein
VTAVREATIGDLPDVLNVVDGAALRVDVDDLRDRLVAEFDGRVRPFWESVGFDIQPADEPDRYRGVLRTGSE